MREKTSLTLSPQNEYTQITNLEENSLDRVSFESNRRRTSLAKIRPQASLPFVKRWSWLSSPLFNFVLESSSQWHLSRKRNYFKDLKEDKIVIICMWNDCTLRKEKWKSI